MRQCWSLGMVTAIAVAVWIPLGTGVTRPAANGASATPVTIALSADSVALHVGAVVITLEM